MPLKDILPQGENICLHLSEKGTQMQIYKS